MKAKQVSNKKRDIKQIEKSEVGFEAEMMNHQLQNQIQNQINFMSQFLAPKKITLNELYQNYQSFLNDDYIQKLFNFTAMVQQYCFWDNVEN